MRHRVTATLLALLAGPTLLGCGASAIEGTNVTTCDETDIVILPGTPVRGTGGGCGGTAGFANRSQAPDFTLHVGDVVKLSYFRMRPVSTNPVVARVGLDRRDSHGTHVVWTLTATTPGATTLYDRGLGYCSHGGSAPECALANFKVIK